MTIESYIDNWGITCGYCKKHINGPNEHDTELKADKVGWRLVLDESGQAHYACPECTHHGYCPTRFGPAVEARS
jgi:hypothetical protein